MLKLLKFVIRYCAREL